MNKKILIVCLALLSLVVLSGCAEFKELYGIVPFCESTPEHKKCICDEYEQQPVCIEAHLGNEKELFEQNNPNCIGYGYDDEGDYVCVESSRGKQLG